MIDQLRPRERPTLRALDVRDAYGFLILPGAACRDVGAATKTLAVMANLGRQSGEVFAHVASIAERACLPVTTVRKHMKKLECKGWIQRCGRHNGRRAVTYKIRADALKPGQDYIAFPKWWKSGQLTLPP